MSNTMTIGIKALQDNAFLPEMTILDETYPAVTFYKDETTTYYDVVAVNKTPEDIRFQIWDIFSNTLEEVVIPNTFDIDYIVLD